jgi:hypothetical protein
MGQVGRTLTVAVLVFVPAAFVFGAIMTACGR